MANDDHKNFSDIFPEVFGSKSNEPEAGMLCLACNGTGQIRRTGGTLEFQQPCSDCGGTGTRSPHTFIDLTITLEEAATGKFETVHYPRQERCEGCGGTGEAWRTDDGNCTSCNSKGFIERRKTKEVSIPPGIETGVRLRISGEGNMNPKDSGYGDLHIVVKIDEHEFFERRGKNIYADTAVQQKQLNEGTEIIVPSLLDGRKKLRIPSGTINGATFRFAGLGVRSIESSERGDLFIKVITRASNADPRSTIKSQVSNASFKPIYNNLNNLFKKIFRFQRPLTLSTIGYNLKVHKTAIFRTIFALIIISAIYNAYFNKPSLVSDNQNTITRSTPKPTVSPTILPTPTPAPERTAFSLPNGSEIIPIQGPRGNRYLKIINGGDSDIAVKVVSSSTGKTRRFVYVRANKTSVFKNIAPESYVLRMMSGSDWDKDTRKFLSNRSFYEFDKSFDFRKTNHSVSLTPTLGGTLRDIPLNEEDFEDK